MKIMGPTAKPHASSLLGSQISKILRYEQRQHNESQGSNRRKSLGMSVSSFQIRTERRGNLILVLPNHTAKSTTE